MHIRIIAAALGAAMLASAYSPGPGSAEWCKGVLEGKIQASQAEVEQNGQKCDAELMKMIPAGL